jgi:hypothetical protein
MLPLLVDINQVPVDMFRHSVLVENYFSLCSDFSSLTSCLFNKSGGYPNKHMKTVNMSSQHGNHHFPYPVSIIYGIFFMTTSIRKSI